MCVWGGGAGVSGVVVLLCGVHVHHANTWGLLLNHRCDAVRGLCWGGVGVGLGWGRAALWPPR